MPAKMISLILSKSQEKENVLISKFRKTVFELSSMALFMGLIQFISTLK